MNAAPQAPPGQEPPASSFGIAPRDALALFLAAAGGALVGLGAKLFDDGMSDAAGVGTDIAFWAVVVSLIGAFAPSALAAAARAAVFMVCAMTVYYVYQASQFGFFSRSLFAGWLALSVTAVPVAAAILSRARTPTWFAGVAVAAPVGVLLAEAWIQRHHAELHAGSLLFNLASATLLIVVLPLGLRRRLTALVLAIPVAGVVATSLDLILRVVPGS